MVGAIISNRNLHKIVHNPFKDTTTNTTNAIKAKRGNKKNAKNNHKRKNRSMSTMPRKRTPNRKENMDIRRRNQTKQIPSSPNKMRSLRKEF